MGPPHDGSWNIVSVKRNADLTCGNEWVCEIDGDKSIV